MVEIIPKAQTKKTKVSKIFFAISFIVLVAVVASYFGLFYVEQEKAGERDGLKKELAKQDVKEINQLKARLTRYQKKIDDFKTLTESRKYPTEFFSFLERNTHSSVSWQSIKLRLEKDELSMRGEAEDLITVIEQLLILKGSSDIKSVELTELQAFREEGGIAFEVFATLDSDIFSK